jgi:hypothetical protein
MSLMAWCHEPGVMKHPGLLNLGAAHGKDHEAAERMMFGFWVFMMSDAILFGMVFATYVTSIHATAGGPAPHDLYDIKSVFIETVVLLTSSFAFGMASLALKCKHSKTRLVGWLAVVLLLGVGFLGFELHDFITMFAKGACPAAAASFPRSSTWCPCTACTSRLPASGWSDWWANSHATVWIQRPNWVSCAWPFSGISSTSSGSRFFLWSTWRG